MVERNLGSRAAISTRNPAILPDALMTVEEPDPVALACLAKQRSDHQEEQKKLNLTCRHAFHLLS